MALTDKLTAIGNAIREKNGTNGTITLPEMETDILAAKSFPTEDIPEYIYTEAKRLAAVVASHQTANSVSFICCSDLHEDGTGTISKRNAMAAYLVKKYAAIDFGVYLGDHIRGSSSDTESSSLAQYKTILPLLAYWCDASVNGNHDNGMGHWDGYLSAATLYSFIGKQAVNVVRPQTEADRGYYYFDVPYKNLRVIMLNTNDLKGVTIKDHSVSSGYNDGHRVSVPQLQWFSSVLSSLTNGQRFIVCSHEPIHWFDYTYTDANGVTWDMAQNWRTILDAYVGGTSYSFTQDEQTVSGDFSQNHGGVCIGTFHGHTHNYIDGKYGTNDIIRIGTPNGCYGRSNEYGILPANPTQDQIEFAEKYGELDSNRNRVVYQRTENTATETSFVVNTIDFDNQVIYSDHYGAGKDRAVSYGATVMYSITKTIKSHCAISNNAEIAEHGSSYTANITADTNYSARVTVKMGGSDITSTAYNNGTITIAEVTGDIEITAYAKCTGNLASIAGYTDDARYSTSSGEIKTAQSGYTAINKIGLEPLAYPVEYVLSGINWTINANCAVILVEGTTVKTLDTLNANHTHADYGYSVEVLSGNSVKLTFTNPTDSSYRSVDGFKVCGYGSGANAVITEM